MTDEQPRGIHLSEKQIVFAVMTTAAVVVVSFLCGVFVGRGVQAARPASAEAAAQAAAVVPDPAVSADPDQAAPLASGDPRTTIPRDSLSWPVRLAGSEPPPETLKPGPAQAGPPEPQPDAPEDAPPGAAPGAVAPPPAGATGGTAAVAPAPGTHTVQVAAVRRRAEAQAIVDRLVKKGFPAYVYTPPNSDRTGGFRVRVGQFRSRAEAEAMASRLKKEEQYQPWITR